MADGCTLGIDIGSTTSKCVILKNGAGLIASSLIGAGTGTSGPQRALDAALAQAGIPREALAPCHFESKDDRGGSFAQDGRNALHSDKP